MGPGNRVVNPELYAMVEQRKTLDSIKRRKELLDLKIPTREPRTCGVYGRRPEHGNDHYRQNAELYRLTNFWNRTPQVRITFTC
jgi:hypothetical protein